VPEDRERAAVGRRPVEQGRELRLRAFRGQPEVPLLGERRVHRGERHLEDVRRGVAFEVPWVKRARDARTEADRIREAETRVVAERQLREVPMRVGAQIVVAVAVDGAGEGLELRPLLRKARRIAGRRVAAVQPDLPVGVLDRLDEARPQLVVRLRRGAVVRVLVTGEDEEGRAGGAVAAFLGEDVGEAPVRIGAAEAVQRRRGEPCGFAHCRPEATLQRVALETGGCTAKADPRPAPGGVDVVRERDGKPRVGEPEPAAEALERRVERIEQ